MLAVWGDAAEGSGIEVHSVIRMGSKAANRSAGRAAEFVNIGRNVVVVLKSDPVETGPTVPVATALLC